jgi:undecaprenyl-diphosphatase
MNTIEIIKIIILAIVQGFGELLPISSSAHVILIARLLGIKDTSTPQFTFLVVMLHTGTMFATIVYFWRRWMRLLFPEPTPGHPGYRINFHFIKMIIAATAATGVLGLGLLFFLEKVILKGHVELLFRNLWLMGVSLAAVGVLMVLADRLEKPETPRPLTLASSIWIGLIQGLCLPFRGFSRSGATISVGLFRGLDRRLAEEFSFALAVVLTPPVILRSLWRVYQFSTQNGEDDALNVEQMLTPGLVGMVFSFLAGLVALKLLCAVLESGRWRYFGIYCLFASCVMFFAAYWMPTEHTRAHQLQRVSTNLIEGRQWSSAASTGEEHGRADEGGSQESPRRHRGR